MSRKGWALFALVGLLWGVPYLFMKVAVEELATPVIVFSRLIIGAAVLVPLAMYQKSIKHALKYWKYIALSLSQQSLFGPLFLLIILAIPPQHIAPESSESLSA
jgi:drug/metabolite transporter (DMT)-like permease